MTRPLRRDARTKGASVITGTRLEADTARALCDYACEHARDAQGKGDVAQLTRYFIRRGLGMSHDDANAAETRGRFGSCVAGLWIEKHACEQLARVADQLGVTKVGAVRHFIRLGLSIPEDTSRERETYFAELAESRRTTGLSGAARFK